MEVPSSQKMVFFLKLCQIGLARVRSIHEIAARQAADHGCNTTGIDGAFIPARLIRWSLTMDKIIYITPGFAVTSALAPDEFAEAGRLGFRALLSNLPDGEAADQLTARGPANGRSCQ